MKYSMTLLFFATIFLPVNAQTNMCNCCTAQHSEFDFWVGSWTVTDPNGVFVGKNAIDKIQDNCILRENWTSSKGDFTGTSSNFYNSTTKQWEQVWLDNQGGNLHLKGNRTGNKMILRSDEEKNKDGHYFYNQITWTLNEDGSVRQYWEIITNNKDITVAFDGLYKKD